MSGIIIPEDRSTKEPVIGYCYNPACKPHNHDRFEFIADNDLFACPKCGANQPPYVGQLVLIHHLKPSPTGPIAGTSGLRYMIGCDTKRAYMATITNLETASTELSAVNCETCLKRSKEK